MILITHTDIKYLEAISGLVELNKDVLAPNNKMIYYLCCTIFKNTSFIAVENKEPIGLIFAFLDSSQKIIWIHQLAVNPNKKKQGVGSRLIKKLEFSILEGNLSISQIKLAVKPDNNAAIGFYLKQGFRFSNVDAVMDMEIWCKEINGKEN